MVGMKRSGMIVLCLILTGFSEAISQDSLRIIGVAEDSSYAYFITNPVLTGSISAHIRYLEQLSGPGGEAIHYSYEGTCCPFRSKNSPVEELAFLDVYKIWYEGARRSYRIYLNRFDHGELLCPVRFQYRK